MRFLETLNNQDSELPKSDPIVRTNDRLKEVFGDKADLLIGIEADDIFTPGTLRKVMELSEQLKGVDGVIEDEIVSLSAVNNIEGREWGLEVGPVVEEAPETPEAIARLKAAVRANALLNGKLVSEDGTLTVIQANVEKGHNQERTHRQVFALVEAFSGPERIHVAGDAVQPQEVDQGIQSDLQVLLPVVLVDDADRLLPVLQDMARRVAAVLSRRAVGPLDHGPHRSRRASRDRRLVGRSDPDGRDLELVWHPRAASLLRGHSAWRAAARAGGAGKGRAGDRDGRDRVRARVCVAPDLSGHLHPPVRHHHDDGRAGGRRRLSHLRPRGAGLLKRDRRERWNRRWSDDRLAGIARFSVRHRKAVLAGARSSSSPCRSSASAASRSARTSSGTSRRSIGCGAAFDAFNARLGGARRVDVMVEGAEPDAIKDPELLRKIQRFQEYAESLPGVGTTSSFADIIRRIHQEMNGGDPAYHVIPESRELVAQYLLLYSISGDPADFAEIVDYDYQRTKIRIMLTTFAAERAPSGVRGAADLCRDRVRPGGSRVEFGGDVMFWLAQIHHIAVGKVYNILTGIAFVLLFCGLTFRSVTAGFFSILPLVISTTLTFGLMGFVGIRLEAATAILTSIAVGVGVDFALHYLINFRQELRQRPGDATSRRSPCGCS